MIRRMFICTKHDPKLNRTRVQIVESLRTGKKVLQKIFRHVGVAHNDGEIEVIKRSTRQLMEQLRADQTPRMELFSRTEYVDLQKLVRKVPRPEKLDVDPGDCREETRLSLGLRVVMGTVYDQLGWISLPGARRKSANRIVRELVMARLSQPESKRATVEALANQAGITLNLDSVYWSMDYLDAPMIDKVCRMSHAAAEKLLEGPVDVLFYDCTTLAFATEREHDQDDEEKDRLPAKGFNKDGRHHRSQVMLALMVTSEGLPVGYELFPGNTWEGHTLKVALEALEKRFDITRIMGVADAGMLSKDNQKMLGDRGLPYILGYRMKSAPAALKARILGKEGAQALVGTRPRRQEQRGVVQDH